MLALLIGGVAVFAPAIAPADPYEAVMDNSLLPPDGQHLCGTDKLGRDVLSRVIYGTRSSLSMTLILVGVIFVVGTGLGILAGYFGGALDAVIMRIADMMISFPGLVLAIAIAGMLGPNLVNAVIAISAVSWTKYARLARSLVLKIKKRAIHGGGGCDRHPHTGHFEAVCGPEHDYHADRHGSHRHRYHDAGTGRPVFPGVWSHGAHA